MSFSTVTLLAAMSQLDRNDTFLLNLLFPEQVNFETEKIAFDEILDSEKLAPFCSPVVAGKAVTSNATQMKQLKPAYIKVKESVDPNRVMTRKAGEAVGGQLSNEERYNAIIGDMLMDHEGRIHRTWESMAAELLRTGKLVIEGEDYPRTEVDFQRDAANTVSLTGTEQWDDANSTPLDDLQEWMDLLDAPCTHIISGPKALNLLGKHDEGKGLLDTRRGSDTKLELAPTANLAAFRGRLGEGGPEWWTYSGYYRDDNGNKVKFIGDYDVLVVSTAAMGVRTFGAIQDKKAGFRALEIFPKMWENEDPSVEYLMSQSAPLPVLKRINATLCATVKQ